MDTIHIAKGIAGYLVHQAGGTQYILIGNGVVEAGVIVAVKNGDIHQLTTAGSTGIGGRDKITETANIGIEGGATECAGILIEGEPRG